MSDLTLTLIQPEPVWEDISANLDLFDRLTAQIQDPTDLILLPEMFTTGFTMNAEKLAQDMAGSGVQWLKETAGRKNADVAGSLIIREKDRFYNRLVWAKPDGSLFCYDKRHLFRMAGEDRFYAAGEDRLTVQLQGWRIRPFICYDLRFPVWCRNRQNAYDAAVFVANWPRTRSDHWKSLLTARAIENQCYVVGVNRVGKDGNGLEYSGDSAVIDPTGKRLFQKAGEPVIARLTLSREVLMEYRNAFPAWMDAD
ncbi:MAG: amidohydrolase [Deltaproteobacteria bacterium]|nr:amidohydrolase [Deltaproteobacteria bacterium]MBW1954272.1 amidohydrolase [Deltaproteobacteria bacterium]MBW2042404.1 amidohydrolase [Deltaproteobacteria bacterium]